MAGTTGSAAAQYRLVRTVPAPSYAAQASFYNPVRDELVIIAVDGTTAQIYNSAGDIVRPSAPLPAALGELTDGAAYDAASGVALVIRQSCELLELDPVTLSISARRTLVGSGTIAPPMICAGVDVGSDGQLYVLDHSMSRVVVYPRTATVPVRDFPVALGSLDNLAHEPGTDQLVIASNEVSSFIVYRESGELVAGPSALGTAIVLGEHTRSNTAGSDGLTFVGSTGRLWFCDHNTPVLSCYLQVRSCTAAADCPLPFIGCDVAMGICASATCGDGNIEGGEECDDGDAMGGDGCSAGCVVEPGFVCNGEPSVCGTCTDDTPFMVDTGCVAARPHCRTTGPRAPACEACIDSSPDLGDLGCTPAAPFCIRTVAGINTCVECNVDIDCDDRVECTTDTCSGNRCSHTSRPEGEVCSIGVCGGPGDDRCVECVSDAQSTPKPKGPLRRSKKVPSHAGRYRAGSGHRARGPRDLVRR